MIELIHQYYTGEKSGFAYVLATGIAFLLTGVLLWLKLSPNPLSKGLGIGLTVTGILLIAGNFSTLYYNNQKMEGLQHRTGETELHLQKSEIQRMDKVLNVTFRYAFISFGILLTALIVAVILTENYYWKGMFIAFMLFITSLLIFDTYNAQRNRGYLKTIKGQTYF